MNEKEFTVIFDHFQFMLGDEKISPLVDTAAMWDTSQVIGVVPGNDTIAGISTVRASGQLSVLVRVGLEFEEESGWNKMGRFDLCLPSGKVIFWGPEAESLSEAPFFDVIPS